MQPVRTSMINNGAPKNPRGEKNISPADCFEPQPEWGRVPLKDAGALETEMTAGTCMHTQETERSKINFPTGTLVLGPQLSDTDNQSETESSSTEGTQKIARWASVNAERENTTQAEARTKIPLH